MSSFDSIASQNLIDEPIIIHGDDDVASYKSLESFRSSTSSSSFDSSSSSSYSSSSSDSSSSVSDPFEDPTFESELDDRPIPIYMATSVLPFSSASDQSHLVEISNLSPYLEHYTLESVPFSLKQFPSNITGMQVSNFQHALRQRSFVDGLGDSDVYYTKVTKGSSGPFCVQFAQGLEGREAKEEHHDDHDIGISVHVSLNAMNVFVTPQGIKEFETMVMTYHPTSPSIQNLCDLFDKQYFKPKVATSRNDDTRFSLDIDQVNLQLLHTAVPSAKRNNIPVPYLVEASCNKVTYALELNSDGSHFQFRAQEFISSVGILNARLGLVDAFVVNPVSSVAVACTDSILLVGSHNQHLHHVAISGKLAPLEITTGADAICALYNVSSTYHNRFHNLFQVYLGVIARRQQQWAVLASGVFGLELKLQKVQGNLVRGNGRETKIKAMSDLSKLCPFSELELMESKSQGEMRYMVSSRFRRLACFIPKFEEDLHTEISQLQLDRSGQIGPFDLELFAGVSSFLSNDKFQEIYPTVSKFFRQVLTGVAYSEEAVSVYMRPESLDIQLRASGLKLQVLSSHERKPFQENVGEHSQKWSTIDMQSVSFVCLDGSFSGISLNVLKTVTKNPAGVFYSSFNIISNFESCKLLSFPEISSTIKASKSVIELWLEQTRSLYKQKKIASHIRSSEMQALRNKSAENLNAFFALNPFSHSTEKPIYQRERSWMKTPSGIKMEDFVSGSGEFSRMYSPQQPAVIFSGDMPRKVSINIPLPLDRSERSTGLEFKNSLRMERQTSDMSINSVNSEPFEIAPEKDDALMNTTSVFIVCSVQEINVQLGHARAQAHAALRFKDLNMSWSRFASNDLFVYSSEDSTSCGLRDFGYISSSEIVVHMAGEKKDKSWETSAQLIDVSVNLTLATDPHSLETLTNVQMMLNIGGLNLEVPVHSIDNKQAQGLLDDWFRTYGEAKEEWQMISFYVVEDDSDSEEEQSNKVHPRAQEPRGILKQKFRKLAKSTRDILVQNEPGLVRVCYTAIASIRSVHANIAPHSLLVLTYDMDGAQYVMDTYDENAVKAHLSLGSSSICFDKSKLGEASTSERLLLFRQKLPRVWIRGDLDAGSKRRPILLTKDMRHGGSTLHMRADSLESISLQSEFLKSTKTGLHEDSTMYSLSGSTLAAQSSFMKNKGDNDFEYVLRLHIYVASVQNRFTPAILEQALMLQSGLAQEINVLLESLNRLTSKAKKKLDSKKKKHRRNSSLLGSLKDGSAPRIRYVVNVELGGVALSCMSEFNHETGNCVSADIKTGKLQLVVKSGFSSDFPVPEEENIVLVMRHTEMLWFARLKSDGLEISFNSSKNPRMFHLRSNLKVLLDPRSMKGVGDTDMDFVTRSAFNHTVTITIRDTQFMVQPHFWGPMSSLGDEYRRAIGLYRYLRANERSLNIFGQQVLDAQGPFEKMDEYVQCVWKNVSAPLQSDLLGTKMIFKTMKRAFVNLQIINTTLTVPYHKHGVPQKGSMANELLVTIPDATCQGFVDNLVTALFDNLDHGESVESLHHLVTTHSPTARSQYKHQTDLKFYGFLSITPIKAVLMERGHTRTKQDTSTNLGDTSTPFTEWTPLKGFQMTSGKSSISITGRTASKTSSKRSPLQINVVATQQQPSIEFDADCIQHLRGIVSMYFNGDSDLAYIQSEPPRPILIDPSQFRDLGIDVTLQILAGHMTVSFDKPGSEGNFKKKDRIPLPSFSVTSSFQSGFDPSDDGSITRSLSASMVIQQRTVVLSPMFIVLLLAVTSEISEVIKNGPKESEEYPCSEPMRAKDDSVASSVAVGTKSIFQWTVCGRILPFRIETSPLETGSLGERFGATLAFNQGVDVGISSGPYRGDDELTCVTLTIPEIEARIGDEKNYFARVFLSSLQYHLSRGLAINDIPVVEISQVVTKCLFLDVNLNSAEKYFRLQSSWNKEYAQIESCISRFYYRKQLGSALSSASTELDSTVQSDVEMEDDGFGLINGNPHIQTIRTYIQSHVGSVKMEVSLGAIEASVITEISKISLRYFMLTSGRDEGGSDEMDLYVQSGAVHSNCQGRLEGGFTMEKGLLLHFIRDYGAMPELVSPFVSAEGLISPAFNVWQPWLKKKLGLNNIIVRLRSNVWCELSLVLGIPNASQQRTVLFVVQLDSFSLLLAEYISESKGSQMNGEYMCTLCACVDAHLIDVQASSEAFAILYSLREKLTKHMAESKAYAYGNEIDRNAYASHTSSAARQEMTQRSLKAVGQIELVVDNMDLSIVHGVLNDVKRSAAASVNGQEVSVRYGVEKSQSEMHRSLSIMLGGKCRVSRFQQLLKSRMSATNLIIDTSDKGRKREKAVFSLPPFEVAMNTKQAIDPTLPSQENAYVLASRIKYDFVTDFRGRPIDLSTDVRDYTYLGEIANSCNRSGSKISTSDAAVVEKFQREFQLSENPDSFVFDPQVNVMGESTSIALGLVLSRLDLDVYKLPETTHSLVSDNLESLLETIHDALRSLDSIIDR